MRRLPPLVALFAVVTVCAAACSKKDTAGDREEPEGAAVAAAEAGGTVIPKVEEAVRVLSRPEPTVDLVAARLEGRISERNSAMAIMQYPGFRILLTTPGALVTRVDFDLHTTRPTVGQLQDLYGEPKPVRHTLLFTQDFSSRDQTMNISAEPVTMPFESTTPVKKIIVRGARRN